jgi:hypothetical protein
MSHNLVARADVPGTITDILTETAGDLSGTAKRGQQ